MKKRLEERFIECTGIFEGFKIPETWRRKWAVVYQGRVFGGYISKQVFGMNRLIRKYDSESLPVVLRVPTKEEERMKYVYAAA